MAASTTSFVASILLFCVPTAIIAQQCWGQNQAWQVCFDGCEPTCDQPNPSCQSAVCGSGGCRCLPGYIRLVSGGNPAVPCIASCPAGFSVKPKEKHWGYDGQDGPDHWGGVCNSGRLQTPIDLSASSLIYVTNMERIQFVNYGNTVGPVKVENTEHSVKVSGFDKWPVTIRPRIESGGLDDSYLLVEVHWHWASNNDEGSEHTVNKAKYPSEAHLVHIRADVIDMSQALTRPDGLAVIGVLHNLGADGSALASIQNSLQQLVGQIDTPKTSVVQIFNTAWLAALLPRNQENFYRYAGSLTTPDCAEAVVWTVFAEPVEITQDQLNLFRRLDDDDDWLQGYGRHTIARNNRPIQPLNGRPVFYRLSPTAVG